MTPRHGVACLVQSPQGKSRLQKALGTTFVTKGDRRIITASFQADQLNTLQYTLEFLRNQVILLQQVVYASDYHQ